jgi:predicted transcriptional regulator
MSPLTQKQCELSEQEKALYKELDKGIDDMENGRTVPHDEAMKQIRERIRSYGV